MTARAVLRRALAAGLGLAGALAVVAAPLEAQRRCILEYVARDPAQPPTSVAQQQPSGQYNVFQGGGVRYGCQGQAVTMEADSAAYYGDLATLYLVGNVRYREDSLALDSNLLTYYQNEEWVVAQGNVDARMASGSTLQGPSVEYFRPIPDVRPAERMIAVGRPVLTLVQPDSAGEPRPPVNVVADRIVSEGETLVYAGGTVVITRPDLVARGDSAVVDDGRQFARLLGAPQIDGRGERPFTLSGGVIDLFSRERELERVLSAGDARVVSEDVDVRSDTIDMRVVENELARAYAWGPSRARATSPGRDIVADSLDVRLPGQRLREVHAIGSARIDIEPDTLRIRVPERDWLSGDTIVARFDSLAAPDDSAGTPPLRAVTATVGARSFQHLAPDSGAVTTRPSIHYVRGREIVASFDAGEVRRVDVLAPDSGLTTGVFLDASGESASVAPASANRQGGRPGARPGGAPGVPPTGAAPRRPPREVPR